MPSRLASQVRKVKPVSIANVIPAKITGLRPRFETADPKSLLVDEAYQRGLSDKSLRLIRKIIGEWDWARFKPPVVAETAAGFEVVDGQHTAIAAASHPGIGYIPIMVVPGISQAARANAFVGHNRDRLGMTPMQIHYAQITAGDAEAVELQAVCAASRVEILRTPPAAGVYKPGQTVAVRGIADLVARRGREKSIQILTILTDAGLGPVNAVHVRAVDHLLHDPECGPQVSPAGLVQAITGLLPTLAGEASVFAATHRVPVWKATASVIFRKAKGRRLSGVAQ
ncbi:DUF6551 family protein [Caulobacter soli]|uniref:DUF6551 family protein n=1 Tax=Caulobacter soli TaxID=2708539 RepID=UPI0013EDEF8D|nr:DUF6551 family protein [Caulobacter soli]